MTLVFVAAVLIADYFSNQWIGLVPGYDALRQADMGLAALAYRNFVLTIILLAAGVLLLRRTGRTLWQVTGLQGGAGRGLLISVLAVIPLYLAFAWAFPVADINIPSVLVLTVFMPFTEEIIYRGLAFGFLRRVAGLGFWPAALLPAAFFAAGHIYQQPDDMGALAMTILITGIGAIVFSWLFEKWNTLWAPIFLHILMNFAWELFAAGEGAYAGLLPTVMQFATILIVILLTVFRHRIPLRMLRQRSL